MQKVKYSIIKQIIADSKREKKDNSEYECQDIRENNITRETITGTAIDVFLFVARFQLDTGIVKGIYYKDIVKATFHGKTQVYEAIGLLERLGYIKKEKSNRCDMDITILNNDFSDKSFKGTGYLSVNKKVFTNGSFFRLKLNEKILFLELLKNCNSAKNGTFIVRKNSFKTQYMNLFQIKERSLRGYLHKLKGFFNIHLKNGCYYVKALKTSITGRDCEQAFRKTDKDQLNHLFVTTALRRNRIDATPEEKKELSTILNQYNCIEQNVDLTKIIRESLKLGLKKIVSKTINIKFIHKIIKEALA